MSDNELANTDEYTLLDALSALWAKKIAIIVIMLIVSGITVYAALQLPNIYRSEAVLEPVNVGGEGGLSAIANQFGGLASLAGINLNASSSQTKSVLAIMNSRRFLESFIDEQNLYVHLFAVTTWNAELNKLEIDENVYDPNTDTWLREVSFPRKPKPSKSEALEIFRDLYSVQEDKETGLVTVSINYISPYVAKEWVNKILKKINTETKRRDMEVAIRTSEYLESELENTSINSVQQIIYQLLEEQKRTLMLTNVKEDYVFKVIDPAFVPEKKVGPSRAILCLSVFVGASLVIAFIIILIDYRKKLS
ncbi:Wzz/FepE/Etk N-terminal domain-containing protein [Alteromonas sp. ASW11-36]|uniref:Wzz/FepE/Etk N-terminal domain-containing protein n=1 Tax=Alteromonas arenosi TaxID=3055817 RepID=A0ABT7T0K1_9ALTE|nr:Wzz/FepE/Etk N-terminal domain-containing protein [Alteromonas sp. ASW11-36]MDM7861970.1 Wzz/FepE/Etk N-terminal domain-containing protein [Alteromonas sp. ASW11-36]